MDRATLERSARYTERVREEFAAKPNEAIYKS